VAFLSTLKGEAVERCLPYLQKLSLSTIFLLPHTATSKVEGGISSREHLIGHIEKAVVKQIGSKI